jgi:hypothetical protein
MTSAPVPGYGLELPSVGMMLGSLSRYLDEEEVPAVWARACDSAGIDVSRPSHSAEELLALVSALEHCGDLAAVCAKGLRIRIMSWAVLSRAAALPSAQVGI